MGSSPACVSMLNETEMYHLTKMRDIWIEAGSPQMYELYMPNKYKLIVDESYFVLVEYWDKMKKDWITIKGLN